MDERLQAARTSLIEARDSYRELRRARPASDAPSFSDCAALHERAALQYQVAAALYKMAMFDESTAAAGEADILAAVADACSEAAGG